MAVAPPDAPHVDWGLVVGLSVGAIGIIASVATHKIWRIVFGIAAWFVLCATFVYATSTLGAILPWRVAVATLATVIVGAMAWPEICGKAIATRSNSASNALDTTALFFKGATIRLADLVPQGTAAIRGKVFEDCEIIGPAVISPDGPLDLTDVQFSGSQATFLIEAEATSSKNGPDGVIYIRETVFRRCSFAQVGIIGTKEAIAEYRKRLAGAVAVPLLKGTVERFEAIDLKYVSEWWTNEFEQEHGRPPNYHESFGPLLARPQGPWYIAWLQIETRGLDKSRAIDWSFNVNHKNGAELDCELVETKWGPLKTWPPGVKYRNIGEVQNNYLESGIVYNVLVHVLCPEPQDMVDMTSFRASFFDSNGVNIVCAMRKSGVK